MAAINAKSQLNTFAGKKAKRPLTKEDVVYATNKFGDQYQSIVKLMFYENALEFAGELCTTAKAAEQSAATQCMAAAALEDGTFNGAVKSAGPAAMMMSTVPQAKPAGKLALGQMGAAMGVAVQATAPATAGKKKKGNKKRSAAESGMVPTAPGEPKQKKKKQIDITGEASNAKTELNQFLQIKKGGPVGKDDVTFETAQFQNGFQTTCTLVCVGGTQFAGEVCEDKKKAEFAAAKAALKAHEAEILQYNAGAEPHVPGVPGVKKQQKVKGPAGPRVPVDVVGQMTGTVSEWKGKFGWITGSITIDHPEAKLNDGKIFVSKEDILGGMDKLVKGTSVQFTVYADGKGLGAEMVQVC